MDTFRFGRTMRALRLRTGMSQAAVGLQAGVSRSTISRIELGRVGRIPFATLRRLGQALGADVELVVRWQGEGLDRLLDAAHSVLVEATVRLLRLFGWEVAKDDDPRARAHRRPGAPGRTPGAGTGRC